MFDQTTNETDTSGLCTVTYASINVNEFIKAKEACVSSDLPYITNKERPLDTKVTSSRRAEYTLDRLNQYVTKINARELHALYASANEEMAGSIEVEQSLSFTESQKADPVVASSFEDAVSKVGDKTGLIFTQESLTTEREFAQDDPKQFMNTVNEMREALRPKFLGTIASAKAFLQLVRIARRSNKEAIAKTLAAKKNQPIM